MSVTLYEVGGAVRDELLNLPTKDVDYVVTGTSWDGMLAFLKDGGFDIFVETPQYLTVRAKFPKNFTFANRDVTGLTADFVLSRKEGEYLDARHPESVEPGSLAEDLARRDFSCNALAKDADGNIIDLHGGLNDLQARVLRCVGSPEDRFSEDALRALRALRFSITKGMALDAAVADALRSEWLPPLLGKVSAERRREELLKAFRYDQDATFDLLALQTPELRQAIFSDGLWLMPTLKK